MKKYKIALISVISVLLFLYAAFLFILPNVVNLNSYKDDIKKIAKDSAGLDIDVKDLKIITTPLLHAGIKAQGISVAYPDGNEFLSTDKAELKIKLVPLIFKTLEIADITIESPKFKTVMNEDGNLDIVDFAADMAPKGEQQEAAPMPFNISDKMPVINVSDYEVIASDKKTGNTIKIKGNSFILDKTVLNKHLRTAFDGKILLNNKENMFYDVKADTFLPDFSELLKSQNEAVGTTPAQINFINELCKFDMTGDLKADLKIRDSKNGIKIDGFTNIEKISAKLDSQQIPESYIHLNFKGHQIDADSDLYISEIEKASLKAKIINSKKFSLDMDLKTDKISFFSMQKFIASLLNSFNIKNDIKDYAVTGYIQSDFSLKTDLKKFKSKGYFKAVNGSITHKSLPVSIKAIGADIDFSKNKVNIKNASALVNGSKLNVKGTIGSNSEADISVLSDAIPLKSLYTVFAPADIKKSVDLQSGILTLNVLIKGKLEEISPKISLKLNNLKIKDKINNITAYNTQTAVDIVTKGTSFKGEININGAGVVTGNPLFHMNIANAKIKITPDMIEIVPFSLMAESSPINISGYVKDYMKKPEIDIKANGSIKSTDLKNLLPKESRQMVSAAGSLPIQASVTGDDKTVDIKAQIKSNPQNHFSVITVKKMLGKNGLINLSLTLKDNVLKINDIGLYTLAHPSTSDSSQDFKKNLGGAYKIFSLTGSITDLDKKVQKIKKLEASIAEPLLVSTPLMPKTSLKVRGRILASGSLASPSLNGFFEIKEINVPEFLTKIDLVNVNFNDALINADIQNLNINGSPLNIKADAPMSFGKIFVINSMEVTSTGLDADKMMQAMAAAPQSAPAVSSSGNASNSLMFPVKINKGKGTIDRFKMGEIIANNASSDFTMSNDTVYLKNLKASAFGGDFKGNINYNLATTGVKAVVNGKSMDANSAVSACAGLKDQVKGLLAFNADITLKGMTYEQQMKTLKGKASFTIKDGQMGSLGRFETFLQAGNLLSQKFIQTQVGAIIAAVAPYNTGKIAYLDGDLTFSGGNANLVFVKSSGPHMSLYITGFMNLVNNNAALQILGGLSPEVIGALGPVGDLSVDKIASYIPKFGSTISNALSVYNAQANEGHLSKIPSLTPDKDNVRAFKVVINGNLNAPQKAVKSFQWLNTAKAMQDSQQSLLKLLSPQTGDAPVKVPVTKEEVQEEIKNQVNNIPQVQKMKENDTVKNLGALYNFYKEKKNNTEQ